MDTNVYTPMDVFYQPRYFNIPLFQRPYVWTEETQWQPLWQDVRRMAELRIEVPYQQARHFLGAIVLQKSDGAFDNLKTHNVIDGQQRLTTLQLLMDATAAVLEEGGQDTLASRLDEFTHNPANFVAPGQSRLKLRHSNRDRAAFDEVMAAEPPLDHDGLKHVGSLVVGAHKYFTAEIAAWLDGDDDAYVAKATALTEVLTNGLQIVVIELLATENSQEIFETLNARGTPLSGADLIKNYVFQKLEAEGVDTKKAYAEDWPFDSKFWETEVSVGRYTMTRGSMFLNQWLMARVGEEIGPRTTFTRFKDYLEYRSTQKMSDLLPVIKQQADLYEEWTLRAVDPDVSLTPVEMAVYRMQAAGIELLKPVLIWLHEPGSGIPADVVSDVITAFESWVVRRQLLRLPSADQGRIVAEAIRINQNTPAAELGERVRGYLASQKVTSTYWPGDAEVREALSTEAAYRRYPRGRLRMYLEAVENQLRAKTNQPQVPRRGYPIEHVLPQKWEDNWGVDGLEAEQNRAAHVHRLGNLTLLTTALNSSVSNGPWAKKKLKLRTHDTFLLNRPFLADDTDVWDEAAIDARTSQMLDALIATWPVPVGHVGEVLDKQAAAPSWIEIKDLVGAGLLTPGANLVPREGKWASRTAVIRDDGRIGIDDRAFDTPSGAAAYVKGSASNGWYFWKLDDGTRLADVRTQYRARQPRKPDVPFDWSRLHEILERLPEGRWTSYLELSDAIGSAPQAVGNHVAGCAQCTNAYRVLTYEGRISPGFRWGDPSDARDPVDVLRTEGVPVFDGKADPTRMLISDDLVAMLEDSP